MLNLVATTKDVGLSCGKDGHGTNRERITGRFLRHRPKTKRLILNYREFYQCNHPLPKYEGEPKALA